MILKKLISYILVSFVLMTIPVTSQGQNVSRQQSEKEKLEKEIRILSRQISENNAKSGDLTAKLNLTKKQIAQRKRLVASYDKEIAGLHREIAASQKEVASLQARMDTLSVHYEKLVRSAYKTRDPKVWYMYILASDNISQAFRRYAYFKNLSSEMRRQAVAVKDAKSHLEERRLALNTLLNKSTKAKAAKENELAALEKDAKSLLSTTAQLKKQRKALEAQAAAKRKEAARLDSEIKSIMASAQKASSSAAAKKGGVQTRKLDIDPALSSSFAKNKGKLPWPVYGPITEKFGQTFHPVFKNVKIRENKGINIATDAGSPVQCIFDGTVIKVFTLAGYNKCILVQHGEYYTLYSKMKSVSVKAGDKVKTGRQLGIVDTLDGITELHFELWKSQTPQNPELWLK